MTKHHLTSRLAAGVIALSLVASLAVAHDYAFGRLKVAHPWSRPTSPGARTAVGYVAIDNTGATADRLVGASSLAADKVEIHQDSVTGGIMRMRAVPEGLVVPAHGSVRLTPGGYHLMFFGPKRPFKPADRIPVALRFEHAGVVKIDLVVEGATASAPAMPGMDMTGRR